MVVVMPTLSKAHRRADEIVGREVARVVGMFAKQVANRVDRPGNMVADENPDQAAPEKTEQGTHSKRIVPTDCCNRDTDTGGNSQTEQDPEVVKTIAHNQDFVLQKIRDVARQFRFGPVGGQ